MTVVYFILPDCRITIRCDPNAGEIIRMYAIINKLPETIFVNVNTASLTVMDFALDYGRIGTGFYFETGDTIVVNVI